MGKPYGLEERTFEFARDVRAFVKRLPKTIGNIEDAKQAIRSSGAIGANYIEANEALGKKDFRMRIRIARKESKETYYWLRLVDKDGQKDLGEICTELIQESQELLKILSAIINKT